MPDLIITRPQVQAYAMQFEGTQKSYDSIAEWIQQHNPEITVIWNGDDGDLVHEAYPGTLELSYRLYGMPMECPSGDWIVKSSRDTFYIVQKDDFNEIWLVLR